MALYNELHVFIDESGDFANWDGKDQLLIGGVFYWGDYGAVDAELKEILLDAMRAVYGAGNDDYNNLHYSNSRDPAYNNKDAYWRKKNQLLAEIRSRLQKKNVLWDSLEGFVLRFESDVLGDGRDSKQLLDNRYERMLEFLVEKVFQRAFWLGTKLLASNGTIHFHIAKRKTVIHYKNVGEISDIARRLGERGTKRKTSSGSDKNRRNVHSLEIAGLLDPKFLEDVFGQLIKRLSAEPENPFSYGRDGSATFEVKEIEYSAADKKLSSAGYYLADLFLGQIRYNLTASKPSPLIVPFGASLNEWRYSPPTKLKENLRLFIRSVDAESFWKNIVQYSEYTDEEFVRDFIACLSVKERNFVFNSYRDALSKVREFADAPGLGGLIRSCRAYRAFQYIWDEFKKSNAKLQCSKLGDDLKLMRFRFELTLANHLGDIATGRKLVASYEAFITQSNRDVFADFTLRQKVDFRVDMALRCVVNHIDNFDYNSALTVNESALKEVKNQNTDEDRVWQGRCYGSLGQLRAFKGEFTEAVAYFNRAIDLFKNLNSQADVEYELVFIGHVICDMRRVAFGNEKNQVKAKWLEFTRQWKDLHQKQPLPQWSDLDAWVELASKSRYIFALVVKAMAYFAEAGEIDAFLDRWEGCCLCEEIKDSNTRDKFEHPYELICQSIGILYESRAKKQKALDYYDYGYQLSRNGGLIIELLGHTSLARALRLSNASLDKWQAWNKSLENIFAQFDANYINGVFGADRGAIGANGDFATSDDYIRKAEKFISAIRFNYW